MGYSLYIDQVYMGIFDTIKEVMAQLKHIGAYHDFDIYEVC